MTDAKQNFTRRLLPSILLPGEDVPNKKMAAQWMYERLVKSIIDFEETLDAEHEVGARLVSFNDNETFNIEDIGFWDPDMIIFYGVAPDGDRVQLMQHISQLNMMLISVKKQEEAKPAKRIGFVLEKHLPNKKAKKKPGRKTNQT